jgi:deoxyadenosine/deoxycytidine kinase
VPAGGAAPAHQEAGPDFERRFDADYLEALTRTYNDFFFHYTDTPLLVINTSDIDFVHNAADLDNLVSVVRKMRKGCTTTCPCPPGSRPSGR